MGNKQAAVKQQQKLAVLDRSTAALQEVFAQKGLYNPVRGSGQMTIVQQFTAGSGGEIESQSVKRTTEVLIVWRFSLSRPFHGLDLLLTLIPAVNCWATVIRPLTAD